MARNKSVVIGFDFSQASSRVLVITALYFYQIITLVDNKEMFYDVVIPKIE